jgi:hypothetical protein
LCCWFPSPYKNSVLNALFYCIPKSSTSISILALRLYVHMFANMERRHHTSHKQGRLPVSEERQKASIDSSLSQKITNRTWHIPRDFTWVSKRLTLITMLSSMYIGSNHTQTLHPPLTHPGLLIATSHLFFFKWLDGTRTEHQSIRQSHVTAISLLIVTGYKASITLAVGIAFSQYMWHVFRRKTFAIRHIEQLFGLRSNFFDIMKMQNSPGAPILFAMAIFVWVLPVATVYPPSALTVSALRYTQKEMRNISILDPPQTEFDPWKKTPNIDSMLGDSGPTVSPLPNSTDSSDTQITTYYL